MKALLIILPKHLLIESRQCWESEKQREDATHKVKNHENKSLMGPLKSLGGGGALKVWEPWGSIPCSPLGRTILIVTPLGVVVWWSCIGAH